MRHSLWAQPSDLEYRCHFIGSKGVVEGLRLFSASDDEAATREAREQLRERASSQSVELISG